MSLGESLTSSTISEVDALVDPEYLLKMDELRTNVEEMRSKIQILVRLLCSSFSFRHLTSRNMVDFGGDSGYARGGVSSEEELGAVGFRHSDHGLLDHVTVRLYPSCARKM